MYIILYLLYFHILTLFHCSYVVESNVYRDPLKEKLKKISLYFRSH